MNLTLVPSGASGGDSRDQSTTQKHPLGTLGVGADGSKHRYAKAGLVALVTGNVLQSPAIVTTHLAMTATAAALGATNVTFTLGGTNAATANQYAEGWLQIDTTPGNGNRYRIASHPAAALSTALAIQLYPDDPIAVAHTTATRGGLISNPYRGVIQMPVTTATGEVAGIANCDLAISNFGWVQTAGMAAVLIAGTPALGAVVMAPGAVAGAAEIIVAAGTLIVAQIVGRMMQVGVAGKNNAVWLTIE